MSKIRQVRVTNPDVKELIFEPAKLVAAFGGGAVAGSFITQPIAGAVDERIESAAIRGIAKLATAALIMGGVAMVAESAKAKPSSKNAPLVASATIGLASGLIYAGVADLTGRNFIDTVEVLDAEVIEPTAAMNGTILSSEQLRALPEEMTTAPSMSGWSSRGGSRFRQVSHF